MNKENNTIDLVFRVPKVCELVFQDSGLLRADLISAAVVSQSWKSAVWPFLWKTIEVNDHHLDQQGFDDRFRDNSEHIRVFKTSSDEVLDWLIESDYCTKLIEICFLRKRKLSRECPAVGPLVARNLGLEILRLHSEPYFEQGFPLVAKALVSLVPGCLTTLDLGGVMTNLEISDVLNHNANSLVCLMFKNCWIYESSFSEVNQLMNVKTLVLDANMQSRTQEDKDGFLNLLKSVVNLTKLVLVSAHTFWLYLLPCVLQEQYLPLLETLAIKLVSREQMTGIKTASLLNVLPSSLRNLDLERATMGPKCQDAFISFTTTNRLTSLKMKRCTSVTAQTWQKILTKSTFLIEVESDMDSKLDASLMTEPWMCTCLEKLTMAVVIGDLSTDDIPEDNNEGTFNATMKDCRMLFRQLSALTRLQMLRMGLNAVTEEWCTVEAKTVQLRRVNSGRVTSLAQLVLSLWAKMISCTDMKEVVLETGLVDEMFNVIELQRWSQKMWGEEVKMHMRMFLLPM